jgi:hypothetical protein
MEKSKKTIILCVIHHRQSPSESKKEVLVTILEAASCFRTERANKLNPADDDDDYY